MFWQDTVDVPEEGLDAESEEGVEDESGEKDAEGEEGSEDADADVDVDDEGEDEGEERDQHGDEEEEDGVSNSSYTSVIEIPIPMHIFLLIDYFLHHFSTSCKKMKKTTTTKSIMLELWHFCAKNHRISLYSVQIVSWFTAYLRVRLESQGFVDKKFGRTLYGRSRAESTFVSIFVVNIALKTFA